MAVMGLDALLRPWLYGLLTPFHEGTCEWPPYLGPSIPSGEEKAGHSQYRPETLYTLSSVSPYPRNHTPGANAVPGVAIGASKLTNSEPGLTWLPAPQEPFSGTKSDDMFASSPLHHF